MRDRHACARGVRPELRQANILRGAAKRFTTPSAYDLLNLLIEDPSLSNELRAIAAHLILRVDEEFKLPADMDLITEAEDYAKD